MIDLNEAKAKVTEALVADGVELVQVSVVLKDMEEQIGVVIKTDQGRQGLRFKNSDDLTVDDIVDGSVTFLGDWYRRAVEHNSP